MARSADRIRFEWAARCRRACVALGLALAALVFLTGAAPKKADSNEWRLVSVYEVTHSIDKAWSAQVFQSADFKHLLLVPDEGVDSWALDLSSLKGYQIPVFELGLSEGKARVPSLAAKKPVCDLRRDEGSLEFDALGGVIRLIPGEPLIGEVSLALLLKRRPDYAASAARYTPDPNAIAILKTRKSPAEIYVAFGTWCSVCKRVVPTLIRTMELAGNPAIKVRYVAIDEDKTEPRGLIKALNVTTTPTIVVRIDGKEVGRSAGPPRQAIERELVNMLTKATH